MKQNHDCGHNIGEINMAQCVGKYWQKADSK
jgi:hypothetical protein